MALPMPAHLHGKETITVKVGSGDVSQEFSVHKALVCAASPYFRGALGAGFQASTDNTIKLEEESPIAFSVLYDFLYTGKVADYSTFYTQNTFPEDLLWLRTLELADFTLVHPLLLIAYERLRQLFSSNGTGVPSMAFIDELYEEDAPQEKLQQYIAAHAAFCLRRNAALDWKEFKTLFERQPDFGVAVAIHFAKFHSDVFKGHKSHPIDNHAFYADEIFPEPNAKPTEPEWKGYANESSEEEEEEEEEEKPGNGN